MPVDWERVRGEFPSLANCTFLNTATYGQTPRRAYEAVERHFARRTERACMDFLDWFDDADRIRESLGRLIGCAADDIAFLPTASASLSLLVNGIDWAPGDRVVTLENEFPNNLYFPALLRERGVEFVETTWDGFYQAVTSRTRLVALSSVNYTTGLRPPVEEVSRFLRQRGVLFFLDGTQSVGVLRMNVREIEPSMVAVDAYKWMLTPNGAGFVYVDPKVRRWLSPQVIGWRSHHDWRSVDSLHQGLPQMTDKAERYEGGMLPFPMIYAMGAVTDWMLEIGPEIIERRALALAHLLRDRLRAEGVELLSDQRDLYSSSIVSARLQGRDASEAARMLRHRGIYVSARHGLLRTSVHFYNNEGDLERLGDELRNIAAGF